MYRQAHLSAVGRDYVSHRVLELLFMTSQKLPQMLQSEKYHGTEDTNGKYLMGLVGALEGDR